MLGAYIKILITQAIIVSISFLMRQKWVFLRKENGSSLFALDMMINFLKVSNLFNVEPYINMEFNEDPIVYGAFADYKGRAYEGRMRELFELREQGDIALSEAYKKLTGKRGFFNQQFCYEDRVCYTLSAHLDSLIPFKQPVYLSTSEVCNISTFPQDYNFCGLSPHYICGMSVPPVMMAQIATRIYEQWLSKL